MKCLNIRIIRRLFLVLVGLCGVLITGCSEPAIDPKGEVLPPPPEGVTIYGIVSCDGKGVPNVVVTDGVISVTTDSKGYYELKSQKENGWVSVSTPSGYEPFTTSCLPRIHRRITTGSNRAEYVSFQLKKVSGQEKSTILFMGDMHLANRSKDLQQYDEFVDDVKNYISNHTDRRFYGVTLGDMSWDTYWEKNKYALPEYKTKVMQSFSTFPIYHIMGNHDHDPMSTGAGNAPVGLFTDLIAPAWYSFNIGESHFIVLDNIDTSKYTGSGKADYTEGIYGRQLEWLKGDLSFVDNSTPVFIVMHANMFQGKGSSDFVLKNSNASYSALLDLLEGRVVHIVTGHTHQSHTLTPADEVVKNRKGSIYEHNIAAVCGDWWYSGYYTPGSNISTDGTPYGYGIWDLNGKEIKWRFKGTGRPEGELFRAYDLNNVHFSTDVFDVLQTPSVIADFKKRYVDSYTNRTNEILINVWGWDSEGWEIKVVNSNGEAMAVNRVEAYDPLSIRSLSVPYYNRTNLTDVPGTKTTLRNHFFLVKASDANSSVRITVTDRRNGLSQTLNMNRPYPF